LIGAALYKGSNQTRSPKAGTKAQLYFKKTALYWLPVSPFPLRTLSESGENIDTGQMVAVGFANEVEAHASFAILSSRVGFLQWVLNSDNFAVNPKKVFEWKGSNLILGKDCGWTKRTYLHRQCQDVELQCPEAH
jgi:hypothetical protein